MRHIKVVQDNDDRKLFKSIPSYQGALLRPLTTSLLFKQFHQERLHFEGFFVGSIALDGFSSLAEDKFGEIPFNIVHQKARQFFFQKLEQGNRLGAINVDLFKQAKLDSKSLSKLLDFLRGARLLSAKLVARKGQDPQTPFSILLI